MKNSPRVGAGQCFVCSSNISGGACRSANSASFNQTSAKQSHVSRSDGDVECSLGAVGFNMHGVPTTINHE
jgi:hypothetical protein